MTQHVILACVYFIFYPSIAKKPYSFVIFEGGVVPSVSAHIFDQYDLGIHL